MSCRHLFDELGTRDDVLLPKSYNTGLHDRTDQTIEATFYRAQLFHYQAKYLKTTQASL